MLIDGIHYYITQFGAISGLKAPPFMAPKTEAYL